MYNFFYCGFVAYDLLAIATWPEIIAESFEFNCLTIINVPENAIKLDLLLSQKTLVTIIIFFIYSLTICKLLLNKDKNKF